MFLEQYVLHNPILDYGASYPTMFEEHPCYNPPIEPTPCSHMERWTNGGISSRRALNSRLLVKHNSDNMLNYQFSLEAWTVRI